MPSRLDFFTIDPLYLAMYTFSDIYPTCAYTRGNPLLLHIQRPMRRIRHDHQDTVPDAGADRRYTLRLLGGLQPL